VALVLGLRHVDPYWFIGYPCGKFSRMAIGGLESMQEFPKGLTYTARFPTQGKAGWWITDYANKLKTGPEKPST
jgi:hypothetical protein